MVKEKYKAFEALRHGLEHFPLFDSTFQISSHPSVTVSIPAEAYSVCTGSFQTLILSLSWYADFSLMIRPFLLIIL